MTVQNEQSSSLVGALEDLLARAKAGEFVSILSITEPTTKAVSDPPTKEE